MFQSGPPAIKKRKGHAGGKLKSAWSMSKYISASTNKGKQFFYSKLCSANIGVSHGGFNDV